MKKSNNNNNWKQTLKTVTFIALVMLVTVVKLSASENKADTLKAKKEVSKEEVIMIEDLLAALEEMDEMEDIAAETVPSIEVYNSNDELVFSGTQEAWNAQNTAELIAAKRKAELLFQLDGTSIYKVF